jgi:uncharacterized protein YndB with AHSA1/START domain
MTMNAAAAVLRREDDRTVLRLERSLAHSQERVWEALTDLDELAAWHPTPFECEPEVGGRITFRGDLGGPEMPEGRVLAYDPPRALGYTWGEDELRFQLSPGADGVGCLLVLEHEFDDPLKAARDAAGWELCLRALDTALDGEAQRQTADEGRLPDGWKELNAEYEQRFGIVPGEATPPPTQEELAAWRSQSGSGSSGS